MAIGLPALMAVVIFVVAPRIIEASMPPELKAFLAFCFALAAGGMFSQIVWLAVSADVDAKYGDLEK